jgi:FLVCR family MFS transporter
MSVIITLCILFYFPSKPRIAPTASAASKEQTESALGGGYKKIFSCSRQSNRLLLIALVFGLMNGIYGGWGAVLNQNLERYNITQDDASWLGFGLVIIGTREK